MQGRFLAALEMTVWENGFISRSVQRICLENAISATVIPSEVEGSFSLAVRRRVFEKEKRETPYRGRAVLSVKGFAQEEGKGLSLLEMRGDIP